MNDVVKLQQNSCRKYFESKPGLRTSNKYFETKPGYFQQFDKEKITKYKKIRID